MSLIRISPFVSRFVCCLLLSTLVSCGDSGPVRHGLSGSITYRGKNVPAGTIRFEPIGKIINQTTIADADITDGKYATLEDRGITGGKHKVYILGYNGIPVAGSGPNGSAVFHSYVVEMDLPSEPSEIDIVVPDSVKPIVKF